jgi:hypothetical protein
MAYDRQQDVVGVAAREGRYRRDSVNECTTKKSRSFLTREICDFGPWM